MGGQSIKDNKKRYLKDPIIIDEYTGKELENRIVRNRIDEFFNPSDIEEEPNIIKHLFEPSDIITFNKIKLDLEVFIGKKFSDIIVNSVYFGDDNFQPYVNVNIGNNINDKSSGLQENSRVNANNSY